MNILELIIYIGNINTMYTLIRTFFYELDNILCNSPDISNPENLVFRQSELLD